MIDCQLAGSNCATDARCEYALHVKALIARQKGKKASKSSCKSLQPQQLMAVHAHVVVLSGRIQESLKLFQQATALSPHKISNLKQVSGGPCAYDVWPMAHCQ